VAGSNSYLLTRDPAYLELPRSQFDHIWQLGELRDPRTLEMSLEEHWIGEFSAQGETPRMFVVPYRYGDQGWFDYMPLSPVYPTALWNLSQESSDWARLEALRQVEQYDWRTVVPFRNKEDCGHEQPWLRYLAGDNPTYPEEILRATYGMVCRRLALIAADQADLAKVHIHHWQMHNPIITEALVQLTLGAPQIIYNGGLLHCTVRYFDADACGSRPRPGLPADVAALVETVEAEHTVIHLVNLSPLTSRTLIIQAGAFGEHQFLTLTYDQRSSEYPGSHHDYAPPPVQTTAQTIPVNDKEVQIHLPPATTIRLDLTLARHVNQPAY
jgi:hypothetical protein